MKLFMSGKYDMTTTVGELVAALQKLDQNALVFTEGDGGNGNVVSVSVAKNGTILIERDDRVLEWVGDELVVAERYRDRLVPPSSTQSLS